MSEALRFSLSPSISEIYDRIRPTSNIMEKGVIWLRDGRNSTALKIGLVALSIVALFGISMIGLSLLPTSPLLGKAIFFIPSFLGAGLLISNTFLDRRVEKEKILFCFESVQEVFGGPEAFSNIPELGVGKLGVDFWGGDGTVDARKNLIKEACQENGALVLPRRLKPEHLTEPLMKGRDFLRRHFVSFKLVDKTDPSSGQFVLTFCETSRSSFQRFQKCAHWVYVSSDKRFPDSFSMQQLHEIVTDKHPKYAFAR